MPDILRIIKADLSTKKSPGHENIPSLLIKWSSSIIAPTLTKIFNRFIDLGKYPSVLKVAKVTALHKGGAKSNIDHYRQISVLSHLNKIFEKLIHGQLNEFVTKHKILDKCQFGFRKGHSTSHGISCLHESIIEKLEK